MTISTIEDLDKLLNEFAPMREEKYYLQFKIASPDPEYNWTDNLLKELVSKFKLPEIYDNPVRSKNIVTAFWYLWIHGDYPGTESFATIVLNTVLLGVAPTKDDRLEFLFNGIAKGKDKLYLDFNGVSFETLVDWKYLDNQTQRSAEFTKYIRETLEKEDWDSPNFNHLMRLTSIVSLMCLRASVKSKFTIENLFFSRKIILDIKNVMSLKENPKLAPPSKGFLRNLFIYLDKNNQSVKDVLAIVVARYTIERQRGDTCDMGVVSMLRYGCLSSTALNGLVPIKLMIEIEKNLKIKPTTIFQYYLTSRNAEQWKIIFRFWNECCIKDKFQYSSYWCRLIRDVYYSDLSTKNVREIMIYLAGIVSCFNEGIWKSVWAQGYSNIFPQARLLGENLLQHLTKEGFFRHEHKETPEIQNLYQSDFSALELL